MEKYYTDEQNIQIVLALLKAHKIRKIVASPGTTNMTLVASMQQDSYFEMYSSVDERSAAYMACGLAAESGEPVVLSCTGGMLLLILWCIAQKNLKLELNYYLVQPLTIFF